MGRTKEQAAADFTAFQRTIPSSDIVIFSDGSRLIDGRAGGSYIRFQAHHQFLRSSLSYGHRKELNLLPTYRSALTTWKLPRASYPPLQDPPKRSLNPSAPLQLPSHYAKGFHTSKVPGHAKIPENEAADLTTKEGAASTPPAPHKSSYTSLKRHAKTQSLSAAQSQWQKVAPQSYQDLEITTSPKRPGELQLNRLDLGHIIVARTGHGDFADYHERFNHDDTYLLCTAKGTRKLASWLAETRFFEDICPRQPLLST
ncbi:conserved hypothetical protein [Talaromyces stipitatus ATCC 10500]|uniref:Uncharacterized protein n=1 Tax=Talaromyces stipitatus (strain ATCC 10500 / CBS 375.48 / QM 6759 / NRRL 1006) TaxID=441959 RepID=B8MAC5_TALSN|nr:uncharacterized protein TSTA_123580 [Talaromyces stipitatus ATCC 10500]EED18627.1 conserved hypothetical protein [Talaromyces stipitatus ATCC 10500]